jgi:hypothetical protein
MMHRTKVSPVLGTGNLGGAQKPQINGDIHKLLSGQRSAFLGEETAHKIQFLPPASAAVVRCQHCVNKVFFDCRQESFRIAIAFSDALFPPYAPLSCGQFCY